MISIRYNQIRELDISNGEGVGISLFVQGCHHNCFNCFNPETWGFNDGKEWTKEVENQFLELADKSYIKRISILGGEPLAEENIEDVLNLVNKIRLSFPEKTIWLYTGYTLEEIICDTYRKKIVSMCNVLVEGRYVDELRDISLKYRGSSNQRIIDVKNTLEQKEVVLWCD